MHIADNSEDFSTLRRHCSYRNTGSVRGHACDFVIRATTEFSSRPDNLTVFCHGKNLDSTMNGVDSCFILIKAIARANELMSAFEEKIRAYASVNTVHGELTMRNFPSSTNVKRWIRAELANGTNITWRLEMSTAAGTKWAIASRACVGDGDALHVFPDRNAYWEIGIAKQLDAAVHELTGTSETFPNSRRCSVKMVIVKKELLFAVLQALLPLSENSVRETAHRIFVQ